MSHAMPAPERSGDTAPGPISRLTAAATRYIARFDDGEVARWAFRGLLAGAIGVVGLDLRDLSRENGWWGPPPSTARVSEPILPPMVKTDQPLVPSRDPRPFVTTDEAGLAKPMTFLLGSGGILSAKGSIEPGTAERFAEEIAARGEYVRTVSLNSPGGALDDAMAMARLLHEKGIATEVADGAICASSCPLIFAGGSTRTAGPDAAIGVHQFYAATKNEAGPEQAMADAQATTARISRHLAAMGVDPAVWLHALDTPPQSLYYLTAKELADYRLVTAPVKTASK